jgi:hypothetical protein
MGKMCSNYKICKKNSLITKKIKNHCRRLAPPTGGGDRTGHARAALSDCVQQAEQGASLTTGPAALHQLPNVLAAGQLGLQAFQLNLAGRFCLLLKNWKNMNKNK